MTAPTPAEVAAVLRATATRLETKGWCQGRSGPEEGPNCVSKAVSIVAGYETIVNQVAWRMFRAQIGGGSGSMWQDAPGRTATEVIATLRACADAVERGDLAVSG